MMSFQMMPLLIHLGSQTSNVRSTLSVLNISACIQDYNMTFLMLSPLPGVVERRGN